MQQRQHYASCFPRCYQRIQNVKQDRDSCVVMSLSFVSKSIQTSRDDGGYDEKPIENSNTNDDDVSSSTFQKPLYEQLRENQDKYELEQEEEKIRMMRGTLALDDDDAYHLEVIQQQKEQLERKKLLETQNEMDAFKMAQKLHRFEQQKALPERTNNNNNDDNNDDGNNGKDEGNGDDSIQANHNTGYENKSGNSSIRRKAPMIIPKIISKKRRLPTSEGKEEDTSNSQPVRTNKGEADAAVCCNDGTDRAINNNKNQSIQSENDNSSSFDNQPTITENEVTSTGPAISGLLSGYGSSSSSDDDE